MCWWSSRSSSCLACWNSCLSLCIRSWLLGVISLLVETHRGGEMVGLVVLDRESTLIGYFRSWLRTNSWHITLASIFVSDAFSYLNNLYKNSNTLLNSVDDPSIWHVVIPFRIPDWHLYFVFLPTRPPCSLICPKHPFNWKCPSCTIVMWCISLLDCRRMLAFYGTQSLNTVEKPSFTSSSLRGFEGPINRNQYPSLGLIRLFFYHQLQRQHMTKRIIMMRQPAW